MQIGIVDLNNAMIRPQDLAIMKQNEDNKGMVNQAVFQNTVDKKTEEKASSVNAASDVELLPGQMDPSQGGNNTYDGDGGSGRRKKRQGGEDESDIPVEGRVIRKTATHFDSKA
ncbi:MAG: hypothetical protein K5739_11060 [Lachnospiraceae bacterium]|nr:hypothetical protein [Lachnospiraceae bacterium]